MLLRRFSGPVAALLLALPAPRADAGEVRAAVAANFTAAMKEIGADFERTRGHRLLASYAATGKLYAQIVNGAPFEVFLAADQRRPQLLEARRMASGRFTYAIGRLVLWSADASRAVGADSLKQDNFNRLAIANPKTAPYGAAAVEALQHLGVYAALAPKLVYGENIAQTYQFVATGNAQLGFVALAQVAGNDAGSRWRIPDSLYAPIRQDAVLLERGRHNPAAQALLDYLRSPDARAIIHRFGYATP